MTQLRKHLVFTYKNRWRAFRQKSRLGLLGENVWIDKSVEFIRFPKNIHVDEQVVVKEGARICSCNEQAIIKIGARTTVGYNTFIFASNSIEIGNDCLVAPFVYLVDSDHGMSKETRINLQANKTAPIKIYDDVWVGSSVTILKGVTIGKGAVIAANSVLNTDVGEYEIWGGTPAKKIGERR